MALSGRERLMREQEEERKRKKEQRNRTDQYKGGERSRTSTLEKREKGAEQARETWNKAKKLTGDSLKFGGKLLSSLDLRDRIASEGEQFKAGKEFNQGLNLGLQMNPQTEAEKQINNNTNKIYNVAENTGTVPKDKASNTPFPTAEIYNKKPNLGTEIFKPGGARPPGIGFKEGGKAMEKINKSKKGTGITNEQALAAFETFAKAIAANSKKDDDRFHTFNNKQFSYSPW